jgi:hypothetical protein
VDEDESSVSLRVDSVSSFLRSRVSSSVVYLLSLVQPLTQREMQGHPLRLHYLRMLTGREAKPSTLKGVLRRGCDCGLLVALTTRRESYYFLNSDVGIRPPSLEDEDCEADVVLESGTAGTLGDVCLPPARALSEEHPIPLIQDPAAFLGWFDWLSDPKRREILRIIEADGPIPRRELSQRGLRMDLRDVQAGIRCGVLRHREGKLEFQFCRTRIPPEGKGWTARPPMFWMTRSYEPLRCLQGAEEYLNRAEGKSPMGLLMEMVEDRRKVIPSRRRRGLRINLLYEPTTLVPRIEELGPGTMPGVWENRRGLVKVAEGGYERALAVMELEEELTMEVPEGPRDRRDAALRKFIQRRLEAYFRRREEELMRRFKEGKVKEYGLGPGAIMSLASVELERERLLEERKYFERFLEVLDGLPPGSS